MDRVTLCESGGIWNAPYGKRSPAMFAQTQGSLVQRELARQRLRDCKGLKFAEQKKVTLSFALSKSLAVFL